MFDTCRLQNTERSLALLNEQTVQQLAFLKENAKKLVGNEPSDFLTSSECAGTLLSQTLSFVTEVNL